MTTGYASAAPDYLAAGWCPLPVPEGRKWPPPQGFTGYAGERVSAEDVARWCDDEQTATCNLALRLPGDVLGIDVDHYTKADGTVKRGGDTLTAWQARLGDLPPTIRSTARGDDPVSGIRLYRVPAGRRWANTLGPGVELVHHGHRYVVAWPSRNPDAEGLPVYRFHDDRGAGLLPRGIVPTPGALPALPDAWVAELDRGPAADVAGPVDRETANALLDDLPGGEPCPYVLRVLDGLTAALGAGGSRHDGARDHVMALVRAGEQGHRGVRAAIDTAESVFLASLNGDRSRARDAAGEFSRMVTGAAAKVAARPTEPDRIGCCGDDARSSGLSWEIVTEDDESTEDDDADTDDESPEAGRPVDWLDVPEFWDGSLFYRSVLAYARARRVGPWALLGAVLARAAASVPPSVVLPPTRGSVASLNLFVALCGGSSGGKSTALDVARDFLDAVGRGAVDTLDTSPGSGEGLLAAYCYTRRSASGAPETIQTRLSVLLDVDEVDSLDSLARRTGSTLVPFLKTAWSGRTLATQNAETHRQRRVEGHTYRLAVVCGVQPLRAGPILDDEAGGFPQRWLWMPTYDPGLLPHHERPQVPPSWRWEVPAAPVTIDPDTGVVTWPLRREVALTDEAVRAILDAAAAHNRPIGAAAPAGAGAGAGGGPGGGGALDGHALLTRAKVAALLALLHGRAEAITADDWDRAGVVMAVSDHTRAAVIRVRAAEAARESDRKAVRAGRSSALAEDEAHRVKVRRVGETILRGLKRRSGEHSERDCLRFVASKDRAGGRDALVWLTESGRVEAVTRLPENGHDREVTYYRAAVGS